MQETLHAYVRVSTKGQLVGKSIESQIEIAKKVAKMLDMKCEIRNEGASSSSQKNKKLASSDPANNLNQSGAVLNQSNTVPNQIKN